MPSGVIFYFAHDDREGIIPLDTFVFPPVKNVASYFSEINYFLTDILQKSVNKPISGPFVWAEPETRFNPEADEGYGLVYAPLQNDNKIAVSSNTYKAAYEIAVTLRNSDFWKETIVSDRQDAELSNTNVNVDDIPETDTTFSSTPPVDPRFKIGDELVNSLGGKIVTYTYVGVHHDPYNVENSSYQARTDFETKTVRIGVNCDWYVTEPEVKEFIVENKFDVHPIPFFARMATRKENKWFVRCSAFPKFEGVGRTQSDAKKDFAVKVLEDKKPVRTN